MHRWKESDSVTEREREGGREGEGAQEREKGSIHRKHRERESERERAPDGMKEAADRDRLHTPSCPWEGGI